MGSIDAIKEKLVGSWYFDAEYGGDPAFNFNLNLEENGDFKLSSTPVDEELEVDADYFTKLGGWDVSEDDGDSSVVLLTLRELEWVFEVSVDGDLMSLSSLDVEDNPQIFDAGPFRKIKSP